MRILLFASRFDTDINAGWLTNDLAAALVEQGHAVDVCVRDTAAPRPKGRQTEGVYDGLSVFSVGPSRPAAGGGVDNRVRAVCALAAMWGPARKWVSSGNYDAAIFTSIAWAFAGLPQHLKRRGVVRRLVLAYWDFFPVHQLEVGHVPRWLRSVAPLLRRIEGHCVSDVDVLLAMSERNALFFGEYFGHTPGSIVIQPPWSRGLPPSTGIAGDSSADFRAVFGGQLTGGRGLTDFLRACRSLQDQGAAVTVDIYGAGPLLEPLRTRIAEMGLRNLTLCGRLSRLDYWTELRRSHCGIAATVDGVSVATFPSKIAEYASAGLPLVVSSEVGGDVGRVVESHGAGWAVPAGQPEQLADALTVCAQGLKDGQWSKYSSASRQWFEEDLSAVAAARRITSALAAMDE